MKKQLATLVLGLVCSGAFSQTNTFPASGNVGIGTTSPQYRLHVEGQHSSTNFGLQYTDQDPAKSANLTLWASEPGWTWTGTGIGNNVYNSSTGNAGVVRVNNSKGGSYIRLLDQELRFNLVKSNGVDFLAMMVDGSGNLGVGTSDAKGCKLAVAGNMIAESVKVKLQGAWPDYVFLPSYKVPTLQEIEKHIKEKGHLPGIPSASEVEKNGVDLGDMNAKLLQKIEELTLHLIEMKKENKVMSERLEKLEGKNQAN